MLRRNFLASLLAVPLAGIKLPPKLGTWGAIVRSEIPQFRNAPLVSNVTLDKNFLFFVSTQMKLHVENPRKIGVIHGIN